MTSVSIIIAMYNVERYIERTVASALAQQDVSVEVIIIDDCSTDGSWDIVSRMTDSRIKAHRLPQNSGPSAARNEAIARASGEWIAILDGDDSYLPARLSQCLARANKLQAQIVVDNITMIREDDGSQALMFAEESFASHPILSLADFIAGNVLFQPSYSLGYLKPVIARSLLDETSIRYNPDIRIGEDYLLLASLLATGAICAIEASACYHYTVRKGSISAKLAMADVARMMACDQAFLRCYTLQGEALVAQALRSTSLQEMHDVIDVSEKLKALKFLAALQIACRHPKAMRHLWLPIKKRLAHFPFWR